MTLSDYDGRTALHLAAAEGHVDCVEFLLKHCNVPYNVRDRWGNTALNEATAFGHDQVIDLLNKWAEQKSINKTNDDDAEGDTTTPLPPHAT